MRVRKSNDAQQTQMTHVRLARLLEISIATFYRNVRAGMPVNSLEAARAWRNANVQAHTNPRSLAIQIEMVEALGELAAGDFATYGERLHYILSSLPRAVRERISLPLDAWEKLQFESTPNVIDLHASSDEPADIQLDPLVLELLDALVAQRPLHLKASA